ncbi:MAG: amidohydrolase [Planctomycetes bacterium]|nr:amidohydrolase [Planctomycetota bacterium]
MLIDCHTHLWRYPGDLSPSFIEEARKMRASRIAMDITPELHWKACAKADRCVVFGVAARHSGITANNDLVADYQAAHPEKIVGFAAIDPNEPGYMEELERTVLDRGLKGVKLTPIYSNYHPMDERMQPVYAFCVRKGLPALFHQGTTFPRAAPLKYSFPVLLEDVALKYPDLVMVVAHLGHPWEADTIVMIRKQPNMYSDVSALFYRPWQFYNSMVLAMEYGVLDKLLFGTDYPVTTIEESLAGIRNLNRVAGPNMPRVPAEKIEEILQRDTLQLLGIPR